MSFDEQPLDVTSSGLRLDARYHAGTGALAAVVMHPHPQYGGDMDNHVVVAICSELATNGGSTLRFNFRGTGRSEGQYEGGKGEVADASAALAVMRELQPETRMVLLGYSFGAMIAAAVAASEQLAALVLVSPPVSMGAIEIPVGLQTLIVTGERDTVSPAEAARALARDTVRVVIVPGADHGWWPGIDVLRSQVSAFVRVVEAPLSP